MFLTVAVHKIAVRSLVMSVLATALLAMQPYFDDFIYHLPWIRWHVHHKVCCLSAVFAGAFSHRQGAQQPVHGLGLFRVRVFSLPESSCESLIH